MEKSVLRMGDLRLFENVLSKAGSTCTDESGLTEKDPNCYYNNSYCRNLIGCPVASLNRCPESISLNRHAYHHHFLIRLPFYFEKKYICAVFRDQADTYFIKTTITLPLTLLRSQKILTLPVFWGLFRPQTLTYLPTVNT